MEGQVVQGGTKENTVEAKKYKDLKVNHFFDLGKNKKAQTRAVKAHGTGCQSRITTWQYH